jgi:hypothetical protein
MMENKVLSVIRQHPEGIPLGLLIKCFRQYLPEAITEMAAKLEADGHIQSVWSVHKRNRGQTITYYPA